MRVCSDGRTYCDPGTQCTGQNTCIPKGSVACGAGGFCPPGSVCAADKECLPTTSARVCADGKQFCLAGQQCTHDNKCIPVGAVECGSQYCLTGYVCGRDNACIPTDVVDCGKGQYCQQGFLCASDNKCLLLTSARVCADRRSYCGPGLICTSDGGCLSENSPRACFPKTTYCKRDEVCGISNKCFRSATTERDVREEAWTRLLNTLPEPGLLNLERRTRNRGEAAFEVQRIENGTGTHVNLDLYEVEITTPPTRGPTSQAQLLGYMRRNLNDFFAPSRGSFGPTWRYPEDEADWKAPGPAPLGAIMLFKAPAFGPTHEEMGVITTASSDTMWIFTPVTIGPCCPGKHPVAGNREFGVRVASNGRVHIYTRGADRVYTHIQPGESFVLEGGDALWRSWQAHVVAFINMNGGEAVAVPPIFHRPLWQQLEESGRFRGR